MTKRGRRQNLTIRIPFDEYVEVVRRAKRRGWSISDFIGYCVVRELRNEHTDSISADRAIELVQGRTQPSSRPAHKTAWRDFGPTYVSQATHLHLATVQVPLEDDDEQDYVPKTPERRDARGRWLPDAQ